MARTKKEEHSVREARILKNSRELVLGEGFLGLKMARVAQVSDISVGTLYTHFPCKEDLILVLAGESWRGRCRVQQNLTAHPNLQDDERLIAAIFSDFLFSLEHPELFAAEQLALTRSIWDGASLRRQNEMVEVHKGIVTAVTAIAHLAISGATFQPGRNGDDPANLDLLAANLNQGVWTLMAGASLVTCAESILEGNTPERQIPSHLKVNTRALLLGHGWSASDPGETIERMAEFVLAAGS